MEHVKRKVRLRVFYAVVLMYWFAIYAYVPILGPYVQYLGGSLQMVGWVVGSYGLTQMLLRIPLGIVSDRLGRRKVFISIGVALAAISSLGMGVVRSPWLILAFRSMAGAAAATWVAFTVLFSSYFRENEASKAMGVIMFFTTLGQVVATTLGGFITDNFGWQSVFLLGSVVGLGGLVLSTQVNENQKIAKEPVTVKELLAVGTDRTLLIAGFLAILAQCLAFSTVFGFTPNYASTLGATASQLSILSLVSMLPSAYTSLKSGAWAEKIGERPLLVLSFLVFAVCTIAIPLVNTMRALYVTQAIAGLGRGVINPLLMGLSIRYIDNERRATAMGFFQSIYAFGMFIGPVLVGSIGDVFGLTGGFVAVGILGLVAAGLSHVLLGAKELKPSAEQRSV